MQYCWETWWIFPLGVMVGERRRPRLTVCTFWKGAAAMLRVWLLGGEENGGGGWLRAFATRLQGDCTLAWETGACGGRGVHVIQLGPICPVPWPDPHTMPAQTAARAHQHFPESETRTACTDRKDSAYTPNYGCAPSAVSVHRLPSPTDSHSLTAWGGWDWAGPTIAEFRTST